MIAIITTTAVNLEPLTLLIVAIGGVITAATPGFLSWMQSRRNHRTMNSRLDELIKTSSQVARAEGKAEGVAETKAETKP